jgi:beta-lactamase regulating signal transducer with metallopeptidase domain
MNNEIAQFCDRILSALCNGLYQGLILAVVVYFLLKILPRTNAATRHAVLYSTLLLTAVLPLAHFAFPSLDTGYIASAPDQAAISGEQARVIEVALPPVQAEQQDSTRSEAGSDEAAILNDLSAAAAEVEETETVLLDQPSPIPDHAHSIRAPASRHFADLGFLTPAAVLKFFGEPRLNLPYPVSLLLIAAWVLIAVARLSALGWQLQKLKGLKKSARLAEVPHAILFLNACEEVRVRRIPRLLFSSQVETPLAIGFFHPAVLLPENLRRNTGEQELSGIFRHELAHFSRHDDWANLIQQILRAALFFHPGILLLSRCLTLEREIACDDVALIGMPCRRSYALFLTELAGRCAVRDWAAAPAAWSNKTQLKQRINMILNTKRNASPRLGRTKSIAVSSAALLLALLAFQAAPRLVVAQEEAAKPAPPAEKTPVDILTPSEDTAREEPETGPRARPEPPRAENPERPDRPDFDGPPPEPRRLRDHPPQGLPPLGMPRPLPVDRPPGPGGPGDRRMRDGDIEKRLERLEHLVASLVDRDRRPDWKRDFDFHFEGPVFDSREFKSNLKKHLKESGLSDEQADKVLKDLKSAEDARLMGELQAGRAKRQMKQEFHWRDERDGMEAQRSAIEAQRRAIEQQMQMLKGQLDMLERQQENFDSKLNKERNAHEEDAKPGEKDREPAERGQ